MAVNISDITVHLSGHVAADVLRLEIDGIATTIETDRTWTWSASVPGGTQTVTMVAISANRVQTRLIEIGSGAAPGGIG
jgi:hypothetical protein